MTTIGFNVGTDNWGGKIVIWSSIVVVVFFPPLIAAVRSYADDRLSYWQWKGLRKRLQERLDNTKDPETRRELEARIKKADIELMNATIETMRGIHAEPEG
ncbi:hypothetical protein ABT160_23455 [Streptomyces sp. NPDC001941]|uniref:hypothetical protein n=1 Tax=Streptomyces sp. NPDC001941 TaxID=3154659 RepID=UPI003329CBC8